MATRKKAEPESNGQSISRQFRQHAGLPERTSDAPTDVVEASELDLAQEPEGGYNQGDVEKAPEDKGALPEGLHPADAPDADGDEEPGDPDAVTTEKE